MNFLNLVMCIVYQIWDGIVVYEGVVLYVELQKWFDVVLVSVGLDLKVVGEFYLYELFGGMKQWVCIVIGVCFNLDFIIVDELILVLDVII